MDIEKWCPVPRFPAYEVSSFGQIAALPRKQYLMRRDGISYIRRYMRRQISGVDNGAGYIIVCLTNEGGRSIRLVHNIVLEAFCGPRPKEHQGCHNDGNKENNRLSNLRWDTVSGNHADKLAHGTALIGAKNHMAKLTAAAARCIKLSNESTAALSRRFNISHGAIEAIKDGRTWKHV